jgi:hypothetical protein
LLTKAQRKVRNLNSLFRTHHSCALTLNVSICLGVQRPMYKLELWLRSGNADTAEKMRVRLLDALTDGEAAKENHRSKTLEFDFKKRTP